MLRGEQKSMAEQVTRFPERDEPAMWAAKDEQHAIECRQKAYAEAAEARRADDAVNAYKRDLELRRRQREQQQKKEAEEEVQEYGQEGQHQELDGKCKDKGKRKGGDGKRKGRSEGK